MTMIENEINDVVTIQNIDSEELPPITNEDILNTNASQFPKKVNRNWLKEILSQHASDSRLETHRQLCEKYPILREKALVVAPMVDQSDLPFRLLCRRYGANLCFTPMIHAKMFTEKHGYRKKFWRYVDGMPKHDRPLIVQLCGSDKKALLQTIRYILRHDRHNAGSADNSIPIDGIDLNCGCPQSIAKRGVYGAFLLEKEDLLVDVVKFLVANVDCPISVKVRILPSGIEDSLKLYQKLVDAGASMLTIHGRTRFQKGLKTGHADWDAIRRVVDLLGHRVPILANGSIANLDDVRMCLERTGADGVMSSEAILEYPPVFNETGTIESGGYRTQPGRLQICREYLHLCQEYPPEQGGQGTGIKCARGHIHRFLHKDLSIAQDIRNAVSFAQEYDVLWKACDDIEEMHKSNGHQVETEELSWYMRHRILDAKGENLYAVADKKSKEIRFTELDDEAADCFANLYELEE
eukprot:CAMPEP_0184865018 /NCGR_PEP_ID=MMETSP0580-20130426/16624_1 /TAXON_ID=1118495 /ORGANISM="Dactyliosolen fragilissimus" /LENGTH=466 /DNA_ID=CAMNT_0027364013 /DNA_START=148 /DNA_END=1545 /DNA_ORIENTATION=+